VGGLAGSRGTFERRLRRRSEGDGIADQVGAEAEVAGDGVPASHGRAGTTLFGRAKNVP
jgi:hypothetical protein